MNRFGMFSALVVVLLAAGCKFDAVTGAGYLNFDFSGRTVKVSSNGIENSIDLKPYVAGRGTYKYTVMFPKRREGVVYVLIDAVSQSSVDATGPCADGTEENIIWLKLDAALRVQDANSLLVDSCLQNIHGEQGYDREENRLTMTYVRTAVGTDRANFSSRQFKSALTYDNDHPEAGLTVETHELK